MISLFVPVKLSKEIMSVFTDERDREFYMTYRKAWENGARSHSEAMLAAMDAEYSRLWVSERQVRKVIDRMRTGKEMPECYRNPLYEHLFESFCTIKRYCPERSVSAIVRNLIYHPVRGFPLSRHSAERIVKRSKRRWGRRAK